MNIELIKNNARHQIGRERSPMSYNLLHGLKLRHLRIIGEIFKTGNISVSADNLGLTPPAVSKACSEIEGLIGHRLFERTRSGMVPTDACYLLIRSGGVIEAELKRLVTQITDSDFGLEKVLTIGYHSLALTPLAMHTAGLLKSRFPNLRLKVMQIDRLTLINGVQKDRFDIGFLDIYQIEKHPDLACLPLHREHWFAAAPEGAISLKTIVENWSSYRKRNWILPTVGFSIRDRFEAMLRAGDLYLPASIIEVNFGQGAKPLIVACNGITLLTNTMLSNAGIDPGKFNHLQILEDDIFLETGIIWRESSANIEIIIDYINLLKDNVKNFL